MHLEAGTVGDWRKGASVEEVEERWALIYVFLKLHLLKGAPMSKERWLICLLRQFHFIKNLSISFYF